MIQWIEIIKSLILGIVQGITEWLPISSTGHMILVDEFLKLNVSPAFMEMFLVVIQLGAIMAVVVLYFRKLNPFALSKTGREKRETWSMWFKVLVGSIPAGIIGLLFNDEIEALFYNYWVVSAMLILYGVLFIIIENRRRGKRPLMENMHDLTYQAAFMIGIFQMLALIPGTSRSGATIVGAMLLGASRYVAAEYTFFLAIPAMFGASLLKMLKFGFAFSGEEILILLTGVISAFLVSIWAIRFLMNYIKRHDFKVFGYYRIVLGTVVLLFFLLRGVLV